MHAQIIENDLATAVYYAYFLRSQAAFLYNENYNENFCALFFKTTTQKIVTAKSDLKKNKPCYYIPSNLNTALALN